MMKINKITLYFLTVFLLFPILLNAEMGGERVGTSIFSFLKINPSARATSLGYASASLCDDASIINSNPAGIIQLNNKAISFSHLNYFADIKYDYTALTFPISSNIGIGIDAGVLHMEPMEITTEYKPYGSGEYFTFTDYFISLAWSQRMSEHFSFGISGKYVNESYLDLKTESILLTLGTYYLTGYKDLRIAVVLKNLGLRANPDGTYQETDLDGNISESNYQEFSPPTLFQLNSAMTTIDTKYIKLLTIFQLNHPVDNSEYYVIANELNLFNTLHLRVGYKLNSSDAPLSYGFGFSAKKWNKKISIDYAYYHHEYLLDVEQIQINFNF
ncbi:MAG: PorV/PorQ family protein [Candidatus Marinimicrobia bacterium]|nr:PorV/PorQ family protein [Candidatus Neomarinimicrobiota bacterium]